MTTTCVIVHVLSVDGANNDYLSHRLKDDKRLGFSKTPFLDNYLGRTSDPQRRAVVRVLEDYALNDPRYLSFTFSSREDAVTADSLCSWYLENHGCYAGSTADSDSYVETLMERVSPSQEDTLGDQVC